MKRPQSGFTLVEIAIVLVIIGLLLGGVLKGQQLIASARVRNIADLQSGVQAAYFGFLDRYRAVPGDMTPTAASDAIGREVHLGDDTSDGQLSAPGTDWSELNGVWEQLSKSGFITGIYPGEQGDTTVDPSSAPPSPEHAPVNPFGSPLVLALDAGYTSTGTSNARLVLHLGQSVPAAIARELDVKLDDGRPQTGVLRNATEVGTGTPGVWQSGDGCLDTDGDNEWEMDPQGQNCNPTYLF